MHIVLIALGTLLVCVSSSMADFDPDPGPQDDDIPLITDEQERKVDETHQKASELLVSAAHWLDSFYDDDRYVAEENTTRARLRLSLGYSRFDGFDLSPMANIRLKLPRLSRKALLIIGAENDDEFDLRDNPISKNQSNDENEKSDVSAALRYALKVGKYYHMSTTVGVSWGYAYVGLRYRYEYDFGTWVGRVTDNFRYYTDDGLQNKWSVDLERHVSRRWFFRTSGGVNWYKAQDGLPHTLSFRLYHILNRHQVLQYEISNYFDTEPVYRRTDLQFRVHYRQRFYRDWLVLAVVPQIGFPYEHNREPNPGIEVRLEADLGYMAEQDVFKAVFGH